MKPVEFKAQAIQSALCHLSRIALSDAFQVDVEYAAGGALVKAFPRTEVQANGLAAFVKAFVWTDVITVGNPAGQWMVGCIVKAEDGK